MHMVLTNILLSVLLVINTLNLMSNISKDVELMEIKLHTRLTKDRLLDIFRYSLRYGK